MDEQHSDNAIKFSAEGSRIDVTFKACELQTNSGIVDAIAVSIADRGPGIPKSERSAIFDKFVQSSKTRTGTGLPISREIILGHRGDVRPDNRPDGGAVITFTLPREQPTANSPEA